ncbi:hypothetical protein LCGC14_2508040 [marine sediment metagenome]|uniref:Uncharacterized protein n=1 Tax=marine sediment metagenome TaxID=412755 RepID=A0A0F9DBV0_9ZZZZ
MLHDEWPKDTVGLEPCPMPYDIESFTVEHGIYKGILVHRWQIGDTIDWCIMAVEGGTDGLNIDYGRRNEHADCSVESPSIGNGATCLVGSNFGPFAAIDTAWDNPSSEVQYKITEVPRV